MFTCVLCEKEWSGLTTHLCPKCRRIKHLINLYDEKVYNVLENVLVRNDQGIENKENQALKEVKEEVENTMCLRNNKVKK